MNSFDECKMILEAARAKFGYYVFDHVLRSLNRQRLQTYNRPKRIHLTPRQKQRMYFDQNGLCGICGIWMAPDSPMDADHINPNLEGKDFNSRRNRQLVHAECNRRKSSKSILEQSKETGSTFREIVGD
jgi:5-methylcytosine-specific restriction endonuclease McrA